MVIGTLLAALFGVGEAPDDCNFIGEGWCLTLPDGAEVARSGDELFLALTISLPGGQSLTAWASDVVHHELEPSQGERLEQFAGGPAINASEPGIARYRIPVVSRDTAGRNIYSDGFIYWTIAWPRDGWLGIPGIEAVGQSLRRCNTQICTGQDIPPAPSERPQRPPSSPEF